MRYELNLFEEIIHGELSPLATSKSAKEYLELIWKTNADFYAIAYVTLKKSASGSYSLLNKKSINGLNPYAKDFADRQMDLFTETKLDDYIEVLQSAGIQPESIITTGFYQQPKKYLLMVKHRVNITDVPQQELKYYYYSTLFKEEFSRLTTVIRSTVFKLKTNDKVIAYIHKLQQALVSLSYRLIKHINPKTHDELYREPVEFTDLEILRMTYACIEELQKFLEKNYFAYLDRSVPVPYRSFLIKLYDLPNKLNRVKTALFNESIDSGLTQIAYMPLLRLGSEALEERMSYKDLIYINAYLTAFYDKIKESNYSISNDQVIELLFIVNFNDLNFVNNKLSIYRVELEAIPVIHEKITYLYKQLKGINQRPSNLSVVYNAQLASLKSLLTDWIEEELSYLNKINKLNTRPEAPAMFYEEEVLKLQSGLSVPQLSFFYKLQAQSGIISHKIQKDIFKHIAGNYKTAKAPDISSDSVGSKFYNVDTNTIQVVKDKIIEMLNVIHEYSV